MEGVLKVPMVGHAIREQFPILKREMNGHPLVFLDSAASSQKPKQVIDAITHYYQNTHANVHRGVYQLSQEATEAYESTREVVKNVINAPTAEQIILTSGATESINLVAHTFGEAMINPGDEVLITGMEHHSNIVPWQLMCKRQGAKLKVVPVTDTGELDIDALRNQLTEKVRILALVHVSNTLGTVNPVRDIVKMSHDQGIAVLVDGAQAIPHQQVDVQELDVDFYAFSGHKVYGPTGVGVLYGKKKWLEHLPPYQGGGEMIATVTFEETTYNVIPHKFEAGTPNIAGAVGLKAALEFVMEMGYDNIAKYEHDLLQYATERLMNIEQIRIIGTAQEKAGVISFLIHGVHPYDTGVILDQMGIAVRTGHHCTEPLMNRFNIPGTVRASFGVYNTKEDVDRLVDGVGKAVRLLL